MTRLSKAAIWCYSLAGAAAISFVIFGCAADRLIPVRVPPVIRDSLGTPAWVSLREAPQVRDRFAFIVAQDIAAFNMNIEDASLLSEILSMGAQFGVDQAKAHAAVLPGGAVITGMLTTLGALFTRRPGDKSSEEYRKEKERSYAKGAEDVERRMREQLLAMGVRLGERAMDRAVDKAIDKVIGGQEAKA
jgi:hypothetical protein